jgi:hypothetical protein
MRSPVVLALDDGNGAAEMRERRYDSQTSEVITFEDESHLRATFAVEDVAG